MSWTLINNSKYQGMSLPEIVLRDPNWFFAQYDMGAFNYPVQLRLEADDVADKARRITIRQTGKPSVYAEYCVDFQTAKLSRVDLLPAQSFLQMGSVVRFRKFGFDLMIPRILVWGDDVSGCKCVARMVVLNQFHLNEPPGRQACEKFFDNPGNFFTGLDWAIVGSYMNPLGPPGHKPTPTVIRFVQALDRVRWFDDD